VQLLLPLKAMPMCPPCPSSLSAKAGTSGSRGVELGGYLHLVQGCHNQGLMKKGMLIHSAFLYLLAVQ
jgi:hypothetical protein